MTARQLKFWGGTPSKTTVILISGKAGVGKTTSGSYMVEYLRDKGFSAIMRAFADPIKDCAIEYFNWDGKKDERGRKLIQMLGTEVGRAYNRDIWVEAMMNRIERLPVPPDYVVIDDWRFENEFSAFNENPMYQTVSVNVSSTERGSLIDSELGNHTSENDLDSKTDLFDLILSNNSTLEDLKESVHQLAERRITQ